jgi:Zn-dependent protease
MKRRYLEIGRIGGAPVRLHWTVPIGALLLTRLRFAPGEWIGFVLLVLLHEIGHALLARHFGLEVLAVDVHGYGGRCAYAGDPTQQQNAVIAWGGVLAQAALLVAAVLLMGVFGVPEGGFFRDLASALTWDNVMLIGLNLLPIAPLDGAEAWKLRLRR